MSGSLKPSDTADHGISADWSWPGHRRCCRAVCHSGLPPPLDAPLPHQGIQRGKIEETRIPCSITWRGECPIFGIWLNCSVLPETRKDDDDSNELLDKPSKVCAGAAVLLGKARLAKEQMQRNLGGELTAHLGHEVATAPPASHANRRNGGTISLVKA